MSQAIAERLPATIELLIAALFATVVFGAIFGFVRARAAASRLRDLLAVPGLMCRSIPVILLALGLELLVAVVLRLPIVGYSSTESFDLGDRLGHLLVPVVCLAVPFGAWSSLIFAGFFRARGASWRIARPVTMTVALIGPALAAATLLTEAIFAWPGVGRLLWNSLGQDDAALTSGILVTYTAGVVMLELCDAAWPTTPERSPPIGTNLPRTAAGRRRVFSALGIAALAVLGIAVLGAAGADVIAPAGPYVVDQIHFQGYPLAPGTDGHPLGTDGNGRDLLALLLVGLRFSLGIAALATLIGTAVAFAVAKAGKTVSWLGVRRTLVASGIRPFAALPFLFAAISILYHTFPAVAIASSPPMIAAVIAISWPALISSFRATTTAMFGGIAGFAGCAFLLEVTLSMLGWGVRPPAPSLGNMLANAQTNAFAAPWAVFVPAAVIVIVLSALYALADDLRET